MRVHTAATIVASIVLMLASPAASATALPPSVVDIAKGANTESPENAAANPALCNKLFNLPENTMVRAADKALMNPEVCEAYAFLITRYNPGPRSSVGLSNPKVEGITRLNPNFAVQLAKMMKALPGNIGINSAYRTPAGQGSKNPQSNHIYGCAIDIGWSQNDCGSQACQWFQKNGAGYGLQIRMPYAPEWNHIEPIGKDACRAGGPGAGSGNGNSDGNGGAPFDEQIRKALGQQPPPQPPPPPPPPPQTPSQSPSPQQPTLPSQPTLPAQPSVSSDAPGTTPISNLINTNPTAATGSIRVATNSPAIQATSTFDMIDQYVNPVSDSIDIGTIVPIDLNANIRDIALGLSPTSSTQNPRAASGTAVGQGPLQQQTFTSSDLANGNIWQNAPGQNTFLTKLLETMKNVLLYALNYLKPFGGVPPNQYVE